MKEGHLYVKNRTDDYHAILFETRLLGQKAVCISGEEAVKMFYDPEKFKRNGAVPKRIQKTLFGENAIQTLDGKEHLHRKALFLSLMGPDAQQHLAQMVRAAWEARIPEWEQKDRIVLFDIQHVKKKTPAGEWRAFSFFSIVASQNAENLQNVNKQVDKIKVQA
ncbi:hypothetical protein ABER60_04210 [Heyndrickxia coagulans]|uniref:hypothetical protein n=1 Tax=Heyndrickxia TaxID=2837504 RepID=UPI0030F9799B